jgi:hypothetical protein
MADNSKKVSELAIANTVATTDRVMVLRTPASNASVRTITVNNFAESIKPLVQNIIPNTTVIANSVTVASNGTSNVAFFSFTIDADKTGCFEIAVHARDATTGSVTAGSLTVASNTTDLNYAQNFASVGNPTIVLDITPTISSNVFSIYFSRSGAATSNVNLRYVATIF